ncbi:hypothetical protein [Cupriavidus necator]|uniref:hypothetical protein n=1 Tax=Cupriavidus necator TaxID=106590 RepID=UPI00339D577C
MNHPHLHGRPAPADQRRARTAAARNRLRQPFTWLALAAAGMALAVCARPAHAAPEDMVIRTMGPVSYVCGGVAEDEREALAAKEKDFNIGILFTQGAAGEYLSDVAVRLVRDEQEVATFRAAGPRCLIRAPEGSYNIEASYKGQAKTIKVSTGTRNAQLRW